MQNEVGQEAFINYYTQLFPNITPTKLSEILKQKNFPVLLVHPQKIQQVKDLWESAHLSFKSLDWFSAAIRWPEEAPTGTILPGYTENLFYPLNASSLLPIAALNPQNDETILDACAAPGGKSLALRFITKDQVKLISNDSSSKRVFVMQNILREFNEEEIVTIHQPAETLFRKFTNIFDKILLDAPCSSEKHVWQNTSELSKWSQNRIYSLQTRQYALLSGLILALRPGGILVYSTCAINPIENEYVINKLLQEKENIVELIPWQNPELPHENNLSLSKLSYDPNTQTHRIPLLNNLGLDPMFVAVLRRR